MSFAQQQVAHLARISAKQRCRLLLQRFVICFVRGQSTEEWALSRNIFGVNSFRKAHTRSIHDLRPPIAIVTVSRDLCVCIISQSVPQILSSDSGSTYAFAFIFDGRHVSAARFVFHLVCPIYRTPSDFFQETSCAWARPSIFSFWVLILERV